MDNNPNVVTAAIENQDWLEPVADGVQNAAGAVFQKTGTAGQTAEDLLNGVPFGHPLHPALTDVPLGAWTISSLFDLMEATGRDDLGPGADAALGIGLIGALASAVTGLTQWYPLHGKSERRVGAAHALLNVGATGLFAASWLLRKNGKRAAARPLAWLGWAVVSGGAYLGGTLSFDQKIGADHAPRKNLPGEFVKVLPEADLSENQPTQTDAGGVPIVLVRQNGRVYALADACAHYGGPLSEGTLEPGCIRCPWHGSTFRLADGRITRGPSTYAQPAFDTRVRDNWIEVRAAASRPRESS